MLGVTRAGHLREWSQGELQLYMVNIKLKIIMSFNKIVQAGLFWVCKCKVTLSTLYVGEVQKKKEKQNIKEEHR